MFEAAISRLDSDRQTAIRELLARWESLGGVSAFAAANLRNDVGLPEDAFTDFLGELASNKERLSTNASDIRTAFEEIGTRFLFSGFPATPHQTAIFGRAILVEKFARYCQARLNDLSCFDTVEDIRDVLRSLDGIDEMSAPPAKRVYFTAIKQTMLGKNPVFATFVKPVSLNSHPWRPNTPSGAEIRNNIALGEDPLGKDYILFAYRLPAGARAHVPITPSPGWSYQRWFRPNGTANTDLHGVTAPIDGGVARHPEIVHPAITGSSLMFPFLIGVG